MKDDKDLSLPILFLFSSFECMNETCVHSDRHDVLLCIYSFTVLLFRACIDTQINLNEYETKNMLHQQHSRLSNSDDDSGCALEEYAWCPPGLKAEQVCTMDD